MASVPMGVDLVKPPYLVSSLTIPLTRGNTVILGAKCRHCPVAYWVHPLVGLVLTCPEGLRQSLPLVNTNTHREEIQ